VDRHHIRDILGVEAGPDYRTHTQEAEIDHHTLPLDLRAGVQFFVQQHSGQTYREP